MWTDRERLTRLNTAVGESLAQHCTWVQVRCTPERLTLRAGLACRVPRRSCCRSPAGDVTVRRTHAVNAPWRPPGRPPRDKNADLLPSLARRQPGTDSRTKERETGGGGGGNEECLLYRTTGAWRVRAGNTTLMTSSLNNSPDHHCRVAYITQV